MNPLDAPSVLPVVSITDIGVVGKLPVPDGPPDAKPLDPLAVFSDVTMREIGLVGEVPVPEGPPERIPLEAPDVSLVLTPGLIKLEEGKELEGPEEPPPLSAPCV